MKWLEQVRVRSSPSAIVGALPGLEALVGEVRTHAPEAEAFILRHAQYSGDLSVVVVWRRSSPPDKTREGLLIANRLQDIGPVDHSIWIPNDEAHAAA